MKSRLNATALALMAGLSLHAASSAPAQEAPPATPGFTLQDFLGRNWNHETVHFRCTPAQAAAFQAGSSLVTDDFKAVPFQFTPAAGTASASVAFQADLKAFQKRTFFFSKTQTKPATDLQITEDADSFRLSNSFTGISLAKRLSGEQGPIRGIRLASGSWIGGSRLTASQKITGFQTQVESRGPVFATISCNAKFANGGIWSMRFRLEAKEPVVTVDESYSLGDASLWELNFSRDFQPDTLFYRYGKSNPGEPISEGKMANWTIAPDADPVFTLEPWLHWWERLRQNTWFGLYTQNGPDLLAMGSLNAGDWVDPAKGNAADARIPVVLNGKDLSAKLPLRDGQRHWMLAALNKDDCLPATGEKNLHQAPLPQQYLLKHGEFSLDHIKDYTLAWRGDDTDHPRMLVTQPQVAAFKANFQADKGKLAELRTRVVDQYHLDEPIQYYLGTGDPVLGRHLAETAVEWIQASVDMLTKQNDQITLGYAPHHQTQILTALNLADAVWSTALTPAERERIKAQVAFLGYTVNTPEYWSPERGFNANANMTTTVAAYKSALAAAIPSHPMASQWMAAGMTEFKQNQLDHWSDDNGGWLEAPHYAMVSYDYILGLFLMAHNAGLNDYLYDPKMKKIIEWFAKVSTPPDSRYLNRRHLPPIGNTLYCEPSGEFGILAGIWKDKDPDFAANMQWMFQQQGSRPEPGIGGFFPTLAGYRQMLLAPEVPAVAPQYGSEVFPRTGAVLRHGFPSDRETMLHLIAGNNHDHYDKDSGSVTLWGKGRIIADDFGYEGYMPGDDHNMVVSPIAPDIQLMGLQDYAPGPSLDYLRADKPGWERQILFVKDKDTLGPSYFVLRDTLQVPTQANWRMWFTAANVTPSARGALVTGKDDVDTDVFFAQPQASVLNTETKTRTPIGGNNPDGTYGLPSVTQIGLIASQTRGDGFCTVIYPRLKTETPPKFTSLADGQAVKVECSARTDYVFLSDRPFTFKEGDISFAGTAGSIQIRNGVPQLSLSAPGKIAAAGRTLEKAGTTPTSVRDRNLLPNGDFETTGLNPFTDPDGVPPIKIEAAAPADANNKASLSLNFEAAGAKVFYLNQPVFVDPSQTYRVSFQMLAANAVHVAAGGYAADANGTQIKRPNGEVWDFRLAADGPSSGWQTVQTTIGPAGSGAQYIWPNNAVSTGLNFWVTSPAGKLYLDNVTFQKLAPAQ